MLGVASGGLHEQISEPAVRSLIKGYLDMRNMVGRGTKTISATPRQLESLIRLSEGLAKMRHARCVGPDKTLRVLAVLCHVNAYSPNLPLSFLSLPEMPVRSAQHHWYRTRLLFVAVLD